MSSRKKIPKNPKFHGKIHEVPQKILKENKSEERNPRDVYPFAVQTELLVVVVIAVVRRPSCGDGGGDLHYHIPFFDVPCTSIHIYASWVKIIEAISDIIIIITASSFIQSHFFPTFQKFGLLLLLLLWQWDPGPIHPSSSSSSSSSSLRNSSS